MKKILIIQVIIALITIYEVKLINKISSGISELTRLTNVDSVINRVRIDSIELVITQKIVQLLILKILLSMKLKKLIVLMTVLVWNCLNGWCQTESPHPLRGNDIIVNVRIDLIRKANVKLIEHKHCPDIINAKDTIIKLERLKYNTLDSLYKVELSKYYNNVQILQKQINSTKRRNKILGGTAVGSIAVLVLTLLIK